MPLISGVTYTDDGHEHDMEGALLVIKKHPFSPFGELVDVLTEAHGALLPWQPVGASINAPGIPRTMGSAYTWNDYRESGHARPVAVSAGGTHGTYMPQLCGPSGADHGYGISTTTPPYTTCIHPSRGVIIYQPMLEAALDPGSGLPQADQLTTGATDGWATYQLIELSQSPLWNYRETTGDLFAAPVLGLGGGAFAFKFFNGNPSGAANPPWAYTGDASCQFNGLLCWYHFSEDGTATTSASALLETDNSYSFLTNPGFDMNFRFSGLPELTAPFRYNPYIANPPSYDGSPLALSAGIGGPETIPANTSEMWQAVISGGTPPYTVQWSGALSGASTSVSGALSADATLFLDVWDSASHHVAVSIFITVCQGTRTC